MLTEEEKAARDAARDAFDNSPASEKWIRDAFKLFDTEEPYGFLTVNELVGILTRPGGGSPMTKEEAVAFVEKHDTNKDGKLDIDEFSKVLFTEAQITADANAALFKAYT